MNQNVLAPYGDFIESKYFLDKFSVIPSLLVLEMPLKETYENIDKIVQTIFNNIDAKVLFERWKISKHKNDIKTNDFINSYFIEISNICVCIQIEINNDNLEMNYWYDRESKNSFKWVETNYQIVRELVGKTLSPTFKVLAKNEGSYYVEEININSFETNINANYNNDFKEIDEIIQKSIHLEKSGLILLHGKPGTGKTTYIKYLLTKHRESNFIFIANDFIKELLQPEFISFLLTQRNSILVIEDAEKVISSREKMERDSVVSTILQLTDGLFSDYLNIKIICTFNTNLNNIDKALLRKGRMIAFYEFRELSLLKTNNLMKSMNQKNGTIEMTLADIYNVQNKSFEQQQKNIGFKNSL